MIPPATTTTSTCPEERNAGRPAQKFAGLIDQLTALTPFGPAAAAHSLACPYELRADKHCAQASNLYGLEYDARGTGFRWSGPSELLCFSLSLSTALQWRISLRFIATSDARNPDAIELIVDGNSVGLSRSEFAGMWLLSSEPVRVQARKANHLVYNVPHLSSPRATDPRSGDDRRLGIAWVDLRLEPQG